ncbi:MAG: hypothetical protein J6Y94_00230 [Bacteriovoracaceae bacterium]|nr:hypothetical protein [Bacteriovoracaceae bacterium]
MKKLGLNVILLGLGLLWLSNLPGWAAVPTDFSPTAEVGASDAASPSAGVLAPGPGELKREIASNAIAEAVEANIKKVQREDERPIPECERYGRNPILCCLAKEEQALNDAHFASGPLYKLNNTLIDEIRNIDGIWPTEEAQIRICHNRDFSPSVALVKELLMQGMNIFTTDAKREEDLGAPDRLQNATAEALVERTPRIFFDYISALQTQMGLPECLNRKIPDLKKFQDKLRDLESEKVAGKIVIPEQIEKIFEGLKNLDQYAQECAAEHKKRLQQQKQARMRMMKATL